MAEITNALDNPPYEEDSGNPDRLTLGCSLQVVPRIDENSGRKRILFWETTLHFSIKTAPFTTLEGCTLKNLESAVSPDEAVKSVSDALLFDDILGDLVEGYSSYYGTQGYDLTFDDSVPDRFREAIAANVASAVS